MLEERQVTRTSESDQNSTLAKPVPSFRSWFRRGRLASWRVLRHFRGLISVLCFQFAFSLAYIVYFSRRYHFSAQLVPIHFSVLLGLVVLTYIGPGAILFSRRIRTWRFSRFILGLSVAAGFAFVALLGLCDIASNGLWHGNVSYGLVFRYLLKPQILDGFVPLLSKWIYAGLVIGLLGVVALALAASGAIKGSLEELLIPGRQYSLFRNRYRALRSCVALATLLAIYGGYLQALAGRAQKGRLSSHEPILTFFVGSTGFHDSGYESLMARLREEEPRARESYPSGQHFHRRNVFIIIMDSVRADHLQSYGYDRPTTPFLTHLLETGALKQVEFATSTCSETDCGLLSTLASKPLRELAPEDFKLYDLLKDQGYRTRFILSGRHYFFGSKAAYTGGLTQYFDSGDSTRYVVNDDRAILEGLEQVPDFDGSPTFFYVHLMSSHFAGVPQHEPRKYQPSAVNVDWSALFRGEYDSEALKNHFDNGILQADAAVHDVLDTLESKGYLKNSLGVILSDHGDGLGERGGQSSYGHGFSLYQECLRIPVFIYDDSSFHYGNLKFATHVDIAPTIVDRLGLQIPRSWRGHSLIDAQIQPYNFHQTRLEDPCYAVLYRADQAIYKYIYWVSQESLYELVTDPTEVHNLMTSADQSLIRRLREVVVLNLGRF
jgi:hypothetical protein